MDNFSDVLVFGGAFVVLLSLLKPRKKRNQRRYRVHPYLSKRNEKGRFKTAFKDLQKSPQFFSENFHMDVASFNMIFARVQKHLECILNTRPKDRICPKLRLAIVLEFLASGTISRHISSVYRISKSSFSQIVSQVCNCNLLVKR